MMLLSVPLLGWFFEQEKHNLQGIIAGLLDMIGLNLGMRKIEQGKARDQDEPSQRTTAK